MSTPPNPQWQLSTQWPVALLPVRVETRFVDTPTGTELWLRILPDVLHVDTHQPRLTDDEVTWGRQYWRDVWRAGRVHDDEVAAWRRLCQLVLPERAAWVARVLEPPQTGRPEQPVPPAEPLPHEPAWPPVPGGANPWNNAPLAQGLPSQWQVTLWRAGAEPVYWQSKPVARPLVVGPPANLNLDNVEDHEPPVDQASRWLVDFQTAVDVGMAGRIPLPAAMAKTIDRLVVFGVDTDPVTGPDTPAARGSRILGELLDAHYHTHGLSLLTPGTPTNNTAGVRSGLDSRDAERADSLRVNHGQQPSTQPEGDAPVTARALGVPLAAQTGDPLHQARGGAATTSPRALARAEQSPGEPNPDAPPAAVSQQAGARHMNTVTWAATWGYFLSDMLTDTIGEEAIRYGRAHFINHVRAAGPVPALRIAEQPYGVLPAIALDRWSSTSDTRAAALVSLLRTLRDRVWRPSVTEVDPTTGLPGVPRVGGPGDTRQALLRILAQGPVGTQWRARSLLGMEYVTHLWRFMRLRLPDDWREQQAFEPSQLLTLLNLAWDPRVAKAVFAQGAYPLRGPLVVPPTGTAADYLDWLGATERTWTDLADQLETNGTATPLLYRVLRQSALAEYATGARRLQAAHAPLPADAYRDAELIDIRPDRESWTLWRQLDRDIPLPTGIGKVGAYLRTADPATEPAAAELAAFRDSARALAAYPTDELERLFAEALDLCAYRLDAWITSFANQRLATMRTAAPKGVHLGGYGWVENLHRRGTAPQPVASPPPGEGGQQLWEGEPNAGYIHAPSLAQATTAAVLRAGYRAYSGAGDNPLAVDLTSERIRLATWLLDGVRQGQPLTELLGYRFERQVQDHPLVLEQYLPRLREIAPIRVTRVEHNDRPREVVAATSVVDGLDLHQRWRAGKIDWNGDAKLPNAGTNDQVALVTLLGALGEAIDSVADTLLAESVHHAAQGNPMRAGATLDAASRGEVPAADLEFTRTPRTGLALTHRVVLAANAWPSVPADWPVVGPSPRAAAEPNLDALVSNLLPRPASVRCRVEWAGNPPVTRPLTLDALARSPLDLLALTDVADLDTDSELVDRILDAAAAQGRPTGAAGSRPTRILPGRPADWTPDTVALDEFVEIARAVRALLTSARPLLPADLRGADVDTDEVPDVVVDPSLATRADTAAALLDQLATDLTSADPAVLHTALTLAAGIGVAGAYAGLAATDEAVLAQARTAATEVAGRLATLTALTLDTAAGPEQTRDHHLARIRAVFGTTFRVLPGFTLAQPAELSTALVGSTAVQGGNRHAVVDWLADAALVRPGVQKLDTVRRYTQAVRPEQVARLRVAQLPYRTDDRWLALPLAGKRPDASRLSVVVDAPAGFDPAAQVCGLVIDEWVEVLPDDTQTTGLTFHAESPGQAAPQAILLAVPADDAVTWTRDALEQTLVETLELAPMRAVDVATLGEVGQFLPALYFPLNVDGATAATDFTRTVPAG
ncbi:hypothetical protein [Micromonospora sp. NPDC093277]|uniref:hypothetical protein n=1 Tax=Micromonospora sp. NPDC093277 TaxID=3364291 RepID=UPI003818DF32